MMQRGHDDIHARAALFETRLAGSDDSCPRLESPGHSACYTVDAGPNVHVICPESEAQTVDKRLREISGVDDVLVARAGGPAKIVKGQ